MEGSSPADLGKRVRDLEKLLEVSLYISSTLHLETLLERAVKVAKSVLDGEGASLMRFDENTNELYFDYIENVEVAEALKKIRLKLGEGIAGHVAATGEPLVLSDVRSDHRFSPRGDEATGFKTSNMVCVPLKVGDRIIGTLQVVNKKSGAFSSDDLPLCMALANMMAIALDNASLHRITEENLKRITELEEAKTAFISILSHELRTPLTSIKNYSEILEKYREKLDDRKVKEYLRVIQTESSHLGILINDLFVVNEIDEIGNRLRLDSVDLRALVERLLTYWKEESSKHTFALEILPGFPPDAAIAADRDKFYHCLYHLLDNAVKFSPGGGKICMYLSSGPEGEDPPRYVEVTVEDHGIGFAEEEKEKIFERFYQIDSSLTRKYGGMGIGLYLCKRIVEAHGGSIFCESAPGEGSRFTVRVPYFRFPR